MVALGPLTFRRTQTIVAAEIKIRTIVASHEMIEGSSLSHKFSMPLAMK
jgi:hypothetical protein